MNIESMIASLRRDEQHGPRMCYDFPLRPTFLAQAVLPRDMTSQEAARLCAFIMALAQPESK